MDPSGKRLSRQNESSKLDPRSPEFNIVLSRLGNAIQFLHKHQDMKDHLHYMAWLKQLQRRSKSLIGRYMMDLFDNACKTCREDRKSVEANHGSANAAGASMQYLDVDHAAAMPPLESLNIYHKFRGLGFRMRELSDKLRKCEEVDSFCEIGEASDPDGETLSQPRRRQYRQYHSSPDIDSSNSHKSVYAEVMCAYRTSRVELLLPITRVTASHGHGQSPSASTESQSQLQSAWARENGKSVSERERKNLADGAGSRVFSSSVRHIYTVVIQIAQLEQQLFVQLFRKSLDAISESDRPPPVSPAVSKASPEGGLQDDEEELCRIVEVVASQASGQLRALAIRENSVGVLCRVIHTITEDVKSQLQGAKLFSKVRECIESNLESTASDVRERLLYCVDLELRKFVEMFEALPSQLAYPDILTRALTNLDEPLSNRLQHDTLARVESEGLAPISTWYPPMRHTLSLLSQIYGVVSKTIFEDVARRAVSECITSLEGGASGVRKWKGQINGDLFLVRHLLILREQLMPFDMKLQSVERYLDFTPTGTALSSFLHNSRRLLNMDSSNSLVQVAVDGIPALHDSHVDVKRKLDETLKHACVALRSTAVSHLLGANFVTFFAKVTAFAGGDVPVYRGGLGLLGEGDSVIQSGSAQSSLDGQTIALPAHVTQVLVGQAFMQTDRLLSVLKSALDNVLEHLPLFLEVVKVRLNTLFSPSYFHPSRKRVLIIFCCECFEYRKIL